MDEYDDYGYNDYDYDDFDDEDDDDGEEDDLRDDDDGSLDGEGDCDFADPGGTSALRRATRTNPRNLPCPTCKEPNVLTPKDRQLGYQCNRCADRCERGY